MEAMASGIVPTLDYSRNVDGYGCNDGFGSWWIIIILFALWGNNGFGNRGNVATDEFVSSQFTQRDIFNTNTDVLTSANATQQAICQTQRDVLDTKYDLGTQILENRYSNALNTQNIVASQKDCCCETNRNIDSVRYDALLTAKDAQMQLAECCCKLEAQGLANTQKIIDLIQQDKIEQLRDQVFATNLALNTQNVVNSIIPRPIPAYPSCSPFVPSYYGFNGSNCGNCGCNNLI